MIYKLFIFLYFFHYGLFGSHNINNGLLTYAHIIIKIFLILSSIYSLCKIFKNKRINTLTIGFIFPLFLYLYFPVFSTYIRPFDKIQLDARRMASLYYCINEYYVKNKLLPETICDALNDCGDTRLAKAIYSYEYDSNEEGYLVYIVKKYTAKKYVINIDINSTCETDYILCKKENTFILFTKPYILYDNAINVIYHDGNTETLYQGKWSNDEFIKGILNDIANNSKNRKPTGK